MDPTERQDRFADYMLQVLEDLGMRTAADPMPHQDVVMKQIAKDFDWLVTEGWQAYGGEPVQGH